MNAETKYANVVDAMSKRSGVTRVTEGKGFGSSGQLKVDGRIFAMLVRGDLVLKLPRGRVEELVAKREGVYFDAGKGKPMKEWFVLSPASRKQWVALAEEAFDFVRGKG